MLTGAYDTPSADRMSVGFAAPSSDIRMETSFSIGEKFLSCNLSI